MTLKREDIKNITNVISQEDDKDLNMHMVSVDYFYMILVGG